MINLAKKRVFIHIMTIKSCPTDFAAEQILFIVIVSKGSAASTLKSLLDGLIRFLKFTHQVHLLFSVTLAQLSS